MTTLPLVEVRDLAKHYGQTVALGGVDLALHRGEVHALLGENGAGKSTLTRVVAGDTVPTRGRVLVEGEPVEFRSPRDALELGIRLVTQERALVPTLSVAENLFIGRLPTRRGGRIDWPEVRRSSMDPLARVGLRVDPSTTVERLSPAEQQLVEIAKSLVGEAALLILDEPTAALTRAETEQLFSVIRELRSAGLAVLYISHRLDELGEIADRCTVLRDGLVAATLPMSDADAATIAELMVGRPLEEMYDRRRVVPGDVVLTARDLEVPGLVGGVDLDLRSGEIVALYGLVGSGATEIPYALAGQLAHKGRVRRDVQVGLVPQDRRTEGLFLEATTRRNLTAASLHRHGWGPLHRRAEEVRAARATAALLRVRPDDPEVPVISLSGGNQQKAVVGRWLEAEVGILVMSEPTRGVDVGARRDIYQLLGEACARGIAVLVASSDLDEVVGLADRVVVIRDGRAVAELHGADIDAGRLLDEATR